MLAEAVAGLHPNPEEHALFLDIHPVSPCRQPAGGWGVLIGAHWPPPGTELSLGGGDGEPGFLRHQQHLDYQAIKGPYFALTP